MHCGKEIKKHKNEEKKKKYLQCIKNKYERIKIKKKKNVVKKEGYGRRNKLM